MAELPLGTVTFLFTDLEGSTRLWEEQPEAMRDALASHDAILRDAIASHRGVAVSEMGDGMAAAFSSANDALEAAVDAQLALRAHKWGETGPLRARMGLHAGEGQLRPDGQYVNQPLNRCARLMAVAHGGQVVVSETVESLVRAALPAEVTLVPLGEHRLRDLTQAIAVFQVAHPALAREFPPLRSLSVLPGNLPVQMTSFVGREEELARVELELTNARVVTLTGVGGVGKTRLALEVAAQVVPQYRDGAWLVKFDGVRDPEAVPDALIAMFGMQAGGLSATTTLVEFLRRKELLLVLDNCEHLLRAVAGLVDEVMRGCPGVRVLATSREGLNVAGERMLGVASLDLPPDAAELAVIAQCDAVVLFVERARAVKATFALDATNGEAVAQVCRRLDGIALAIELAAARVAMLTPSEVARRLDQRFRLLAGGQRTAVERHQTLRAAIDWSYEMLNENEQLLLTRLSIFAGGFTLEAAEAVAAGGTVETDDVFDVLATLVARSLVLADTEGVETRYRFLETIRQYAQERLDDSGDGDRLRAEHAAYYAGFAERALTELLGPDGHVWEGRFAQELDNLRAALTWATDTRDVDTAMRLLGTIAQAVQLTTAGELMATTRWAADIVLAIPSASEHPKYPDALVLAAMLAWGLGDQEQARRRCDEAFAAEQRLGTEPSTFLWIARSSIAMAEGQADEASAHAAQAIALSRARGELAPLADALGLSALALVMAGDAAAALPDVDELVVLVRTFPNPHVHLSRLAMAGFALANSDPERALALAREAVALAAPGERNSAWAIAGDVEARYGRRRDALTYMARGIDTFHWMGARLPLGTVIGRAAGVLVDTDPEAAAVLQGAGNALAPGFAHAPHYLAAEQRAVEIIDAAFGAARRQELYAQGMAMTDADAVDYANAAIARSVVDETT